MAAEGYVYNIFGHPSYLKHAVASVNSLRRYDTSRPVVLVCQKEHKRILVERNLTGLFDKIHIMKPDHASIVGFKHNIHDYLFFDRNMFLDSDIIWCKNPDPLWESFKPFEFTITGTQTSDIFFGGPKHLGIIFNLLLRRRERTLKRFGLTYLCRVQTGMIYASDYNVTEKVCELSQEMLKRKEETHFLSRTKEEGRKEESCEWSLAMAMSKLDIPVYPWLQGHNSPQLDYIAEYTKHDIDYSEVICTYFCDDFIYNLRGIKNNWLRNLLTKIFSLIPGRGDYIETTPYCLHFGWIHQKQPFFDYSEHIWNKLLKKYDRKVITSND